MRQHFPYKRKVFPGFIPRARKESLRLRQSGASSPLGTPVSCSNSALAGITEANVFRQS